jgi:hypothetical protein
VESEAREPLWHREIEPSGIPSDGFLRFAVAYQEIPAVPGSPAWRLLSATLRPLGRVKKWRRNGQSVLALSLEEGRWNDPAKPGPLETLTLSKSNLDFFFHALRMGKLATNEDSEDSAQLLVLCRQAPGGCGR